MLAPQILIDEPHGSPRRGAGVFAVRDSAATFALEWSGDTLLTISYATTAHIEKREDSLSWPGAHLRFAYRQLPAQ
jgi:hypothetical protein